MFLIIKLLDENEQVSFFYWGIWRREIRKHASRLRDDLLAFFVKYECVLEESLQKNLIIEVINTFLCDCMYIFWMVIEIIAC